MASSDSSSSVDEAHLLAGLFNPDLSSPPPIVETATSPTENLMTLGEYRLSVLGFSEILEYKTLGSLDVDPGAIRLWSLVDGRLFFGDIEVQAVKQECRAQVLEYARESNLSLIDHWSDSIIKSEMLMRASGQLRELNGFLHDSLVLAWKMSYSLGARDSDEVFSRYLVFRLGSEWWAPFASVSKIAYALLYRLQRTPNIA
jgi:hypothetical protein